MAKSIRLASGSTPTIPPTPIVPSPSTSLNQPKAKYYVFNQTGNIMMSTTSVSDDTITQQVRDVFNEVSVFFAAMTKAITNTINPTTGQPYSIYNYNALSSIIGGSGLFVHVTEEDVSYDTKTVSVSFSQELVEAVLGLPTGAGELAFASAMVSSAGKEGITLSAHYSNDDNKVANITFVCEYLMGMPVVSVIVLYTTTDMVEATIKIGPCISAGGSSTVIQMHKDTYMFVTPTFIKQYAGDLDSVTNTPAYIEFVSYLESMLVGEPVAGNVTDSAGNPAGSYLDPSVTYTINGSSFGRLQGTGSVGFGSATTVLNVTEWTDTAISFQGMKAKSTAPVQATAITVTTAQANTSQTTGSFLMVAPPVVKDLIDASTKAAVASGALDASTTYTIEGQGFGNKQGSLSFGTPTSVITVTSWSDSAISFLNMAAGSTSPSTNTPITITPTDNAPVQTTGAYTITKSS
jgi:hypothetical protein